MLMMLLCNEYNAYLNTDEEYKRLKPGTNQKKNSLISVAMEVYSALLGERLTVLEADDFELKTVKSVKQSFAAQFPGFTEN